jgi:LPS sulfotransferase NodH
MELLSTAKCFVHKYLYPLLPDPKNKVVIISSGRSGSNFLVSLLSSHPDIYLYGEVIGESYMRHKSFRRVLARCGPKRYIRNCFKKRFYKQVVGMKILYYQFREYYGRKWNLDNIEAVLETIRSDTDIKIVHLKRRNMLKILASQKIATLTGHYVVRDEQQKQQHRSVELSPEKCESFFEKLSRTREKFDDYFKQHETFEVHYTDLVSNRNSIRQKLLKFLGVKQCPLTMDTIRQSSRSLAERIDNYDALKEDFKNTRWECFFED